MTKNRLYFAGALYNEENELDDLVLHVSPYVDKIFFVDDGSEDNTARILQGWTSIGLQYKSIEHTGLPETVKRQAIEMVPEDDAFVLMLDADERLPQGTLEKIREFVETDQSENISHVWFGLDEFIDGELRRSFLKCRLFRKSAIKFSPRIHEDDIFEGQGANLGWHIIHRKTSGKQRMREMEYIRKYQELLDAGEITQDRVDWMKGLHYFVKELPNG